MEGASSRKLKGWVGSAWCGARMGEMAGKSGEVIERDFLQYVSYGMMHVSRRGAEGWGIEETL